MSPECPRVHVIFDQLHDADLLAQLREESRDGLGGFRIEAQSGSAAFAASDKWERMLGRVDEVIVICGLFTGSSTAVSAELRRVQRESKPYFLLWGRRGSMCRKPQAARRHDAMYSWTPQIVVLQLHETLRQASFCADPPPRRHMRRAVPEPS